MSTYYIFICEKHKEYVCGIRDGGKIELMRDEKVLGSFVVAHTPCDIKIRHENHPDVEKSDNYKEWDKWNCDALLEGHKDQRNNDRQNNRLR
jgi:hypothetical protein